jgi:hypothetical protein
MATAIDKQTSDKIGLDKGFPTLFFRYRFHRF